MGYRWDEKLDNLESEIERVASSDDPNDFFYVRVDGDDDNSRGGYEVFVGKLGSVAEVFDGRVGEKTEPTAD